VLHVAFWPLPLQLCPGLPVPISALCLVASVPAMAQNQTSMISFVKRGDGVPLAPRFGRSCFSFDNR